MTFGPMPTKATMAQPLSQMVDIMKDAIVQDVNGALVQAITKPAIKQDLYNAVTKDIDNTELMKKHFSTKDALLIHDIKTSVYNILSSVGPVSLTPLENAIVAGGCFASMFHGQHPNDYDIFVLKNDPNRGELYHDLTRLVERNPKEWKHTDADEVKYLQNQNIETVFTYEHGNGYYMKIQYIFTKFHMREELIDDFDFQHCCTSMTLNPKSPNLFITPATHKAIVNKILKKNPRYNREPAKWRVDKFIERGWKPQLEFGPPGTTWVNGKWVTI